MENGEAKLIDVARFHAASRDGLNRARPTLSVKPKVRWVLRAFSEDTAGLAL